MADLMQIIVRLMQSAGTFRNMTGAKRKAYVISKLLDELDVDEDVIEFINEVVDVLIQTEKGKVVFNPVVKKIARGCCF